MTPLSHYLVLGAILFGISVVGIFLNRKNVVILLMSIELMLLAVNMNFVAFSRYLDDTAGQVFVFFILTVAAAEAAIGLAILIVLFRSDSSGLPAGGHYCRPVRQKNWPYWRTYRHHWWSGDCLCVIARGLQRRTKR